MGTTADKLNSLIGTKQAIKEAIVAKGVSVSEQDTFRSYADKIMAISQEMVGIVKPKDLNFYDYDGTVLYSYSAAEVEAMTELPEGPKHEGLVFDGWSSTLEEVKDFISQYGRWGVGAYFDTEDGTARLYITLTDQARLDISFKVYCAWSYAGTIDWGDGVVDEFSASAGSLTLRHAYSSVGDYVVRFKHISGDKFGLYGNGNIGDGESIVGDNTLENSYYLGIIRKVEMCKSIYLEGCPFRSCGKLETITFASKPPTVNSSYDQDAFSDCISLKHICGMMSYGYTGCSNCKSLKTAIFRFSGTSGNTSRAYFYNCLALEEVYIYGFHIESRAFSGCVNLKHVVPTNDFINGDCFVGCESLRSLRSAVKLSYDNQNFKGGHFEGCVNLEYIDLSSAPRLEFQTFKDCRSLNYLIMPKVSYIGYEVFMNCASLQYIDFSAQTSVPTLNNADSFTGVSSQCKVYIPSALLKSWKAADQWKTVASFLTPAIDVVECTSLTLVGENASGNATSTKATFTAIVNGYHPLTGKYIEGATYVDEVEIQIPKNPSQTESIEREISFEFYGVTASATIQQGPYVDYKIVCKYNATASSATTLLYSSYANMKAHFSHMVIDGVEYPISASHTFESDGEHEVVFKVSDDVITIANFYRLFSGVTALTEADLSMVDMSAATSTSTSSGTAYMFYGCTNLKKIVFPETIKYLGYYMLFNCTNVTELAFKAATAPTLYGYTSFGAASSAFVGYKNRNNGTNKLYVPIGSTGYNTGYWVSYLQDTAECGFTKEEVEF